MESPTERSDLTLRAVLVALAVAALMGAAYPFIVLRLGFGPNLSVVSALLGWAALAGLARLQGGAFRIREANLVQTAGTTAAQSGFMCVLLAAFDLLAARPELGVQLAPTPLQAFLWLSVAGLLGVVLSMPLRRRVIDDEPLPFPDGIAAGELLKLLEQPGEARARGLALAFGGGVSALLGLLQQGLHWLPEVLPFGAAGKALRLGLGLSVLSLGSGMLVSLRIALSMALGLLLSWVLLPGWLVEQGMAKELTFGALTRWLMWPATGLLVAGGFTSLFTKGAVVGRALSGGRSSDPTSRDPRWWGAVVGLTALLATVQAWSLDLPPWQTVVAVLLSWPLLVVGTRVLGETNWAPISALSNGVQALFALLVPGQIAANLAASGVAGTVATNGEHLMQDFRAARIVGGRDADLVKLQFLAVPVGAAAVAWTYPLLRDRFGIVERKLADGTVVPPGLASPISVKWAGFAELLAKGTDVLPPGAATALALAVGFGVLLALLEKRWPAFVPSPTGIGIGMLVPAQAVLPMVLGALVRPLWRRLRGAAEEEALAPPLASGFIAGEALFAVALALRAALG